LFSREHFVRPLSPLATLPHSSQYKLWALGMSYAL